MMHQLPPSPKGFTLVETLVAIAILMLAIVGPFYSVQQAIKASYAARDELIASSLAQEGVEYVYFIRDNNYLLTKEPFFDIKDYCSTADGCMIDPTQNTVATCISAGCEPLRLSSSGLYTQDTSNNYPATRFTRKVQLITISSIQTRVIVTVTWITGQQPYSETVTENLYNWL